MRCPACKNKLLQKSGSTTRLRIQGAVEFDSQGVARAQCYWCKAAVEVPIDLRKAESVDEENFTISVRGGD